MVCMFQNKSILSHPVSPQFISSITSHSITSFMALNLFPCHPIRLHPISFYPTELFSTHPISFHSISCHLISSYATPSHSILSYLFTTLLFHLIPFHLIPSIHSNLLPFHDVTILMSKCGGGRCFLSSNKISLALLSCSFASSSCTSRLSAVSLMVVRTMRTFFLTSSLWGS